MRKMHQMSCHLRNQRITIIWVWGADIWQKLSLMNRISITHYNDVIMGAIASQITSLTIVYSTVYSDADQRKHQSFASLAFVRGIHRGPVNFPHKWPVTRIFFHLMTSSWVECFRIWCEYETRIALSTGILTSHNNTNRWRQRCHMAILYIGHNVWWTMMAMMTMTTTRIKMMTKLNPCFLSGMVPDRVWYTVEFLILRAKYRETGQEKRL